MFDTAELGRKVTKEEFAEKAPPLRQKLLETQHQIRKAGVPVVVVFGGVDGAGKSETVNLLNEWLDPRWLITRAYGDATEEMEQRPLFWRYWRELPPNGRIAFFLSAWYSDPILDRVHGRNTVAEFDESLERIVSFEKALVDGGALVVKFWMHLGKGAQKERYQQLEENPLTAWRVKERDWENWERYDNFIEASERAIMRTSLGRKPWHIVEGADENYRTLSVAGTLLDRITRFLEETKITREITRNSNSNNVAGEKTPDGEEPAGANHVAEVSFNPTPGLTILSHLDMTKSLEGNHYRKRLEELQGRLYQLSRRATEQQVSSVLVFEGWDAGGKGGAIRRIIPGLDARISQVIPIMAPTEEELAHHYLWRFWRHIPPAGRVTIFDRSWYGRVLVERVEGFATEDEWRRSYSEINDFEEQLVEKGTVLCKFWIHITKDEQEKRFNRRQSLAHKKWKMTDEDWRNREKWDLYETAVNEMIERTSLSHARWTLVEGNDKKFARIKVLETVCEAIERGLGDGSGEREGEPS
jgi:polyphosphate:AMP phosphotransferase